MKIKLKLRHRVLAAVCTLVMLVGLFPSNVFAMTYHDNDVILKGVNGLSISSGTFALTEYSITSGQDPNGKNHVGDVYSLNGGKFTFSAGRKGSSDVADWFNSRFSGYNDPGAINGDRTTFDHTAGSLNFAFVGNLTITVSGGALSQPTTVVFNDATFAQGSSGTSNNWWFGQKAGQHTLDSDGDNTVLLIGNEAGSGRTVYASFYRGGNAVNEVALRNIYVTPNENAVERSVKLPDIPAQFNSIPIDGTSRTLKGMPTANYDIISCHYQGYTQYGEGNNAFSVLTHSVASADYAHIVAGKTNSSAMTGYKTFLKGSRHPGGIQTFGDYLLVPTESENSATIAMYDLRSLNANELRRVESFRLNVPHKAGAIGITDYKDADGNEWYLLIIGALDYANSRYNVYRASAAQPLPDARFTMVGELKADSNRLGRDYQGFGLLTDTNGKVYMVGLWTEDVLGLPTNDYAYLYEVGTTDWTANLLSSKHLNTHAGGALGVHFRYGAGISTIGSTQKLQITTCERNGGSSLGTNFWIAH